jgi:membrane protease YdiL (CAAX protease family)
VVVGVRLYVSGEPRAASSVARSLGLSLSDARSHALRGAVGCLVVYPAVAAAANVATLVSEAVGHTVKAHPVIVEVTRSSYGETATLVAIALIVAPAMEELFFRGFVYAAIRDRLGVPAGIIISALLFGLVHPGVLNCSVTFVLGAALAALYERAGSLVTPFVAHATFNGVQLAAVLSLRLFA